jgi:hypothetical protein
MQEPSIPPGEVRIHPVVERRMEREGSGHLGQVRSQAQGHGTEQDDQRQGRTALPREEGETHDAREPRGSLRPG